MKIITKNTKNRFLKPFLVILLFVFSLIILEVIAIATSPKTSIFSIANEKLSPSDWIKEDQIKVYHNSVKLKIKNATWVKFTDTNSMDPLLDETANALEIVPTNPIQIKPGDIISYKINDKIIIHRVINIGTDDKGYYYIVKGDNNNREDPIKVRFSQIVGVLVAIIY